MKTFSAKGHEVQRDWFVIDATDKILGRVASEVARRLRGKHKPEFTPSFDTGDYIIVLNAGKVRVTGNKLRQVLPRPLGLSGRHEVQELRKAERASPRRSPRARREGDAAQNLLAGQFWWLQLTSSH